MANDNELVPVEKQESQLGSCFGVTNYSDAQRVAMTLASSDLVPEQYRLKQGQEKRVIGNCLIALDMALRLKMSPLFVMQNMYIVHGRPSWSASFLVAAINKSGLFKTPLRYKESGEGDDKGCIAWAVDHSGEVLESIKITMEMAKKEGWSEKTGSKWKTMPQQMLRYRAATFFCRAYCPEVAMGMQTQEELIDIGSDRYEPQDNQEVKPKTAEEIADEAFGDGDEPATGEVFDGEPPTAFEQASKMIHAATTTKELNDANAWYQAHGEDGTGEITRDEEVELTELFTNKKDELKGRK